MPGVALSSTSPPLVLHVIHHLVIGGMENGLVNIINRMPSSAYRHAIACIEDYSDFRTRIRRPDVEVFALHRNRVGVWPTRAALFRWCRAHRPAIVHTRNLSGLDALLPALLAGVRHRVHGEHGFDVDNLDGRQLKAALLRRLHSPLVDRYVTVSKDIERLLVDRVGIAPHRIQQIYNGVDTATFRPRTPLEPRTLLPDGFAGENICVVGTVGRAQAVKDQGTLLRAFAHVRRQEPALAADLRLVVVGGGPLQGELQALARAEGIADLAWLPGPRADVPDLLRAMDLFVLPSLNEGISNTILEAMASGVPVIATGVGGNLELVSEGATGAFFPPGDTAALARLIADAARDRERRRALGRAARATAEQRFGLEAMVASYQAVYDQLLQR